MCIEYQIINVTFEFLLLNLLLQDFSAAYHSVQYYLLVRVTGSHETFKNVATSKYLILIRTKPAIGQPSTAEEHFSVYSSSVP